jgi:23S rRNA pseudouridine1911/1915/1917 synthase
VIKFLVAEEQAGTRLDQIVARAAGCSAQEARRLIADGRVRVDGAKKPKGLLVTAGAAIAIEPFADDKRPLPQPELALALLHEDTALLALDKPAGMPTHPLRAGEHGTLANALVARFPECAGVADDPREGGVAHRLDVDTSGVVLAGRTREAWLALRRAFSTGAVTKEYLALVAGKPPDEGELRGELVHATRRRMQVDEWGESEHSRGPVATRYRVEARGRDLALVRATSSSGRMHQIRAHFAHAGWPLVGDSLYGGPPVEGGHWLHAAAVTVPHPATGKPLRIEAPVPEKRSAILEKLIR